MGREGPTNIAVKKLLLLGFGIVFLSLAYVAAQGEPRSTLVGRKLSGDLPQLGMTDVLRAILPRRSLVSLGSVLVGEVRIKRREGEGGPCSVLWQTPLGDFWGHEADSDVISFAVAEQLVSKNYQNSAVHVRPGDTVIDLGSHLGLFTRAALNRGAATVVSIEPAPRNILCFKKTFEEEIQSGAVHLIEAAAWNESGKLRFSADPEGHEAARGHVEEAGEIEVDAVTIDEVVAKLGLQSVDFIKMDIEGAERFALQGADRTLHDHRPQLALSSYHRPDDPAVLRELASRMNPKYDFSQSLHYLYVR